MAVWDTSPPALRASDADRDHVITDLPHPPDTGLAARLAACVAWCAQLSAQMQAAWRLPRLPPLVLPPAGQTVFTIGRSPASDLMVADMTVSWRHAELRRVRDHWLLADVGSTNGTRVNGWRAGAGLVVGTGDRVEFGQASFRVAAHR
jgi:Inner membrane component of T3SS, cytoplasmic domain